MQILLKALFLLAIHAFLRLGEPVVRDNLHTNLVLQQTDVIFQLNPGIRGVKLLLKHFKHKKDQSAVVIFVESQPTSAYFPVKQLIQYLTISRHETGSLFFIF